MAARMHSALRARLTVQQEEHKNDGYADKNNGRENAHRQRYGDGQNGSRLFLRWDGRVKSCDAGDFSWRESPSRIRSLGFGLVHSLSEFVGHAPYPTPKLQPSRMGEWPREPSDFLAIAEGKQHRIAMKGEIVPRLFPTD
jgi:hypothetical protein